ncbi:MAG: hypothetical protein ABFD97_19635 [Syntrophobacter sp.]
MTDKLGDAPLSPELTDEQSFREMVEAFASIRSDTQQRKFPRFPTAGALSGKLGLHGFEGTLISERALADEERRKQDLERSGADMDIARTGANIVDFSENGIQLELRSVDFSHLQRRSLSLEIQDQLLPLRLRWWSSRGSAGRGGFLFADNIDSDPLLARFISTLNTQLISYLMSTYLKGLTTFTNEAGVFIYMAIFYGLRLKFLETIAERKKSNASCEGDRRSTAPSSSSCMTDGGLSKFHHMNQVIKYKSDTAVRNTLYKYVQPYHTQGCSILGMHHDVVFLKEEAYSTIFNSILCAGEDCRPATSILPKLSSLHNDFLQLKRFLAPRVFEDDAFENQFRYYSDFLQRIDLTSRTSAIALPSEIPARDVA